jgi:hypothetical protein
MVTAVFRYYADLAAQHAGRIVDTGQAHAVNRAGVDGRLESGGAPSGSGSATALRHGTVWIDDYHPYIPGAEWGGFKRSGNGRELGPTGSAEYQELEHIWHNTAPKPMRWFSG